MSANRTGQQIITGAMLVIFTTCGCTRAHGDMSPAAESYLKDALWKMQTLALKRDQVDWKKVGKEAFARARGAQTSIETYDAVRYALKELGDHHSFLLLTPELHSQENALKRARETKDKKKSDQENSNKESSDKESSDKEPAETSNGQKHSNTNTLTKAAPSPFTQRFSPSNSLIERNGHKIGLLVVPRYWGESTTAQAKTFAHNIRDQIAELRMHNVEAWIIDLRGNIGGNMWPMLAGLAPLLGAEEFGSFRGPNFKTAWIYKDGAVGVKTTGAAKKLSMTLPNPPPPHTAPMAVLIDNDTASSGEAVAVAFEGRPKTRFFGRATAGLSTANAGFPLADGAKLELTVSIDADRTGKVYPAGIEPDENVEASEGGEADIEAALKWLLTQ